MTHLYGPKAQHLYELQKAGFNVPAFLVIDFAAVTKNTNGDWSAILEHISQSIGATTYAVRSAAAVEDSEHSSWAGQFHTELDVSVDDLATAIESVIAYTKSNHGDQFDGFSVVVQEYIEGDYTGVVFSRNPVTAWGSVIEYSTGPSTAVVDGKTAERIGYFPDTKSPKSFPYAQALAELAQEIELYYKFPQDIEWVIRNDAVYVVQSRPITSISKSQWKSVQLLDKELSSAEYFLYEQTSLNETFTSPRPLAFSLLQTLYSQDGPIDQAYTQLGITYTERGHLRLFGNELYTDTDLETKTIFPTSGYKKNWFHIATTIQNWWKLSFLKIPTYQIIESKLLAVLEQKNTAESFANNLAFVTAHYPTIFLTNLYAQKTLTDLQKRLGSDAAKAIELTDLFPQEYAPSPHTNKLTGNSVSLDDGSLFVSQLSKQGFTSQDKSWWDSLPNWKQHALKPHIEKARDYQHLRELGRHVSVHLMQGLRDYIKNQPEWMHFATVQEILNEQVNQTVCKSRQEQYEQNKDLVFPDRIASVANTNASNTNIGVSPGSAAGIIVSTDEIDSTTGDKILLVDTLSPDLVQYFDQINGIVSRQGGLLSHLAIMARESGIPVVVSQEKALLATLVEINGTSGVITSH